MAEYIDRETFVKFFEHKTETQCQGCTDIDCLACFQEWIAEQPGADVAPVVHGRWLKTGYPFYYPKCAECENQSIAPYNYCPNCGAKMDGGVNDG